jgi:hypothetical protein
MNLLIVAIFYSIVAPTFADQYVWEPAQRANCRGEGLRQYTSTIKLLASTSISDADWLIHCANTSNNIPGYYGDQNFPRPTRCRLSYFGLPRVGEFDMIDPTCFIEYDWLWEKVGKILGKSLHCLPTGEKIIFDGCTVPFSDQNSIIGKDFLNAACVAHDLCYETPASYGITKAKCDQMMHDLAQIRCKEVNSNKVCFTCAANWYSIPIRDWRYDGWKLSQTSYDEAQDKSLPSRSNPCTLYNVQRKSDLYQGSQMNIGAVRWSPDGAYLLIMQPGGNLVLYAMPTFTPIWSSKTDGLDVVKAVMQRDGNFVLYTKDNVARWHTGTDGNPTNHLLLQTNGKMVIYSVGSPTVQWSSDLHGGYLIPMSTNLRSESLDSTSNQDIGTMTKQEALSDTVDIAYLDHDPISALGQELSHTLDGVN